MNPILQVKAEDSRADMEELVKELQEVCNAADSTKEELNNCRQRNEQLQGDIQVRDVSISQLKEELQEVRKNVDTTKEELYSYKVQSEKLQGELRVREMALLQLKEELQEVRTATMTTADTSPAPSPQPLPVASPSSTTQPKRKAGKQPAGKGSTSKDKSSLSRKAQPSTTSSSKSHSPRLNNSSEPTRAVTDSFTQTEVVDFPSTTTKEEMEEVIAEFQEKIAQMQELHAAEILDMEARHISESDNLRRDTQSLEDECKALQAVIEKLRSAEVRTAGSSSLEGRHVL